ncbi:alpha/beta hydrolase [Streptomyces sp. NBC_01216]|nr:alpha/beta hydrolase [Streptomyces sp. NBC_01216]
MAGHLVPLAVDRARARRRGLPGSHCRSSRSRRVVGGFAKQELAGDVARLVGHLGIARYAVVGHDWGGTVGYLLAADHPDRVSALVVEEELLPGIDVVIPEPGRSHYPSWHGPFFQWLRTSRRSSASRS